MDAPPVQYVTTKDGYDIAYAITGSGPRTLVMAPMPFGNLREQWGSETHGPRLKAFASRFRLVQYDSRGEGMSTRGLPEGLSLDHYVIDLDAVIGRCGAAPVILFGPVLSSHVAVRYAVHHPQRLAALILFQVNLDDVLEGVRYLEELARSSWENFLKVPAYNLYRLDPPTEALRILRESMNSEDFFKHLRLPATSLAPLLPSITVPTLVIGIRGAYGPRLTGEDEGKRVAALIPESRLLILNVEQARDLPAYLDEFVSEIIEPSKAGSTSAPEIEASGLSARELEVLRLLAAGKSNQQIADELVISLNTVRRHVSNIFDKAGVANRTEAAGYARDHGLLSPLGIGRSHLQ